MGLGFARAILGEEPKKDPRPWVRGCENELATFDRAVTQASCKKRVAEFWQNGESWLASYDVVSDDALPGWGIRSLLGGTIRHNKFRIRLCFWGVYAILKELWHRGSSVALGDVCPKEVQGAWAEHFRLIGEGTGSVKDRVWANVPCYSPMDVVWGNAPAPNELHAALRQMSLGKAAEEDEVSAEFLKFGGNINLWEAVVRVCREQWLLLTEVAPGAEVVWPEEWCVGLVVPLWKRKGNKRNKNTWRGITLLSVGSKFLARVVSESVFVHPVYGNHWEGLLRRGWGF